MVVFKFRASMPIFVARQWVRHRTASINEVSARYTELPGNLFEIKDPRQKHRYNKQGSDAVEDPSSDQRDILKRINDTTVEMYNLYQEALDLDIAPEQARMGLPLNIYTEMIWKMDLHNLFHFLKLRLDEHAQLEIRQMAQMILDIITPLAPISVQAWKDYVLNAVTFSSLELDALRKGEPLQSTSQSELEEFRKKIKIPLTSRSPEVNIER